MRAAEQYSEQLHGTGSSSFKILSDYQPGEEASNLLVCSDLVCWWHCVIGTLLFCWCCANGSSELQSSML